MEAKHDPLERRLFQVQDLMAMHPPLWRDRSKQVVYTVSCPPGATHRGRLAYTRWQAMPIPAHVDTAAAERLLEVRADVFDYAPTLAPPGVVEWHVNFADPDLFFAYGSALFAQDEMQVAEHPALGALRQALLAEGSVCRTVESGRPTPVLVAGVERRCRVAVDHDASQGRPEGLYGMAFSCAPAEAVRRATTPIEPPTITNLIAMAAPAGGRGRYTAVQIDHILATAFTGFRAAVIESEGKPVVVHTGFWGCGAFGGNRVLMVVLQMLAAGMAGIDKLVFHAFNAAGTDAVDAAVAEVQGNLAGCTSAREMVQRIVGAGFEWGMSDGN